MAWISLVLVAAVVLALLFAGRPALAWLAGAALTLAAWAAAEPASWIAFGVVAAVGLALTGALLVPPLRRRWITARVLPRIASFLPRLGEAERTALEAGTVGWERELFAGSPDWRDLLAFPSAVLRSEERDFLDGPVEELCARLDDWQIAQAGDLPPEAWDKLRRERFFGLVIPVRYGGRGFSAAAHSAVVAKLASRSPAAAITAMVPNSLGPAELILHYGTDEQRDHYLPRLARGEEIPCFALTGPEAGSDAAAMASEGIVCEGEWDGKRVLGVRLNWCKRYITLAPVATLIGLAFRLRDPDGMLGRGEDVGITLALVPAHLPGIEIGKRHDPMGVAFQNGPIRGSDVFVPIDALIGGPAGAGRGWQMLMESLAVGRAISLPAVSSAAARVAARCVSAYAVVREQFDLPIGRFEGVEEPLARIAGLTYAIDALRGLALAALDAGERPAVPSAIAKAYSTEAMRAIVNDAMDIRAGAGIMRGPRNVVGRTYPMVPIGITVEGANILTRCLIIYGQGALRCHRYALEELDAVAANDLARFDRALFGHVGHIATSAVRALLLGLSSGRLERRTARSLRRVQQRLGRLSAAFAVVSEAAMLTLGGELKRREKLTGRLADTLSCLYVGSAIVKRFHDDGEAANERVFAEWAALHVLEQGEAALVGVLRNLPNRFAAFAAGLFAFPRGQLERGPDDRLGSALAQALLGDPAARARLTGGIYLPRSDEPGLGVLESALTAVRRALSVEAKLRAAVSAGILVRGPEQELARRGLEAGVITSHELEALEAAEAARARAIEVDAFDAKDYTAMRR
jgi:acyl-CoA dehydrogenase